MTYGLDSRGQIHEDGSLFKSRRLAITSVGDVVAGFRAALGELATVRQRIGQAADHVQRGTERLVSLRGSHELLRRSVAQFEASAQRLREADELLAASGKAIEEYLAIIGAGTAGTGLPSDRAPRVDSRGREIPHGVERLPSGKLPSNYMHAGRQFDGPNWTPKMAEKYPDGVVFSEDGFPNFAPYAIHTVTFEPNFLGNHTSDFAEANRKAGLDATPDDHTWHHHQGTQTMQLIPRDLHRAVPHAGGVSIKRCEYRWQWATDAGNYRLQRRRFMS